MLAFCKILTQLDFEGSMWLHVQAASFDLGTRVMGFGFRFGV